MAHSDSNDPGPSPPTVGFLGSLTRSMFGGSIVTHMTWIVLGGIFGVGWVANSSFADPRIKMYGMWLVTGLSLTGLGTLVWTSVSPLANVLGKDMPDAIKSVREKGKRTSVSKSQLRSTEANPPKRRQEKGRNE